MKSLKTLRKDASKRATLKNKDGSDIHYQQKDEAPVIGEMKYNPRWHPSNWDEHDRIGRDRWKKHVEAMHGTEVKYADHHREFIHATDTQGHVLGHYDKVIHHGTIFHKPWHPSLFEEVIIEAAGRVGHDNLNSWRHHATQIGAYIEDHGTHREAHSKHGGLVGRFDSHPDGEGRGHGYIDHPVGHFPTRFNEAIESLDQLYPIFEHAGVFENLTPARAKQALAKADFEAALASTAKKAGVGSSEAIHTKRANRYQKLLKMTEAPETSPAGLKKWRIANMTPGQKETGKSKPDQSVEAQTAADNARLHGVSEANYSTGGTRKLVNLPGRKKRFKDQQREIYKRVLSQPAPKMSPEESAAWDKEYNKTHPVKEETLHNVEMKVKYGRHTWVVNAKDENHAKELALAAHRKHFPNDKIEGVGRVEKTRKLGEETLTEAGSSKTKMKRKYLGKSKGRTKVGTRAHKVDTEPKLVLKDNPVGRVNSRMPQPVANKGIG